MSSFLSYSIGYVSRFKSITLHNGSTRCALGFIGGSPALRDSRILLPNGTIYDPNLRSDGSYLVPTTSQSLQTVTQEFKFEGVSASDLEAQFNNVRSGLYFSGQLTATSIGTGKTFYCTAQMASIDNSRTTPGTVYGRAILFSVTWYMTTDWEG